LVRLLGKRCVRKERHPDLGKYSFITKDSFRKSWKLKKTKKGSGWDSTSEENAALVRPKFAGEERNVRAKSDG